ncbi:MAG: DNA polymerase III subunit beta [Candidatus Absconditabacteria bacterium]|nr:DNA polymerase III subunit beta [Candidatus Absconditabacteria bacterium]MDD3868705.1 DNA polymerase III subunit beta [Candidatus Absconditabacteria bacterium]MDD4714395.1 DNA polymerase III subunit beta [Candidatus Absconditabacteria bacterium]
MKITIELSKLVDVVDIASKFVSKNSTLPILQNIYLKASIDSLIIRATDMEKYVEIELPCDIKIEGAVTVNARMFLDLLRSIEEKEVEISVNMQNNVMQIKSAEDDFEINGIPASEYVALPEVPQNNVVTLETRNLVDGVERVEYTITEKNFSPVLTGVLVKTKNDENGKKLVFVGTDSFRIAEYKISATIENDFSLIIPKIAINDIKNITKYAAEKETSDLKMKYSENLIAFEFEIENIKITATSLLIQGNFPDYEREEIMPTSFNHTILVDKTLCGKAIKKIGILTKDINNFIQIETQADGVIISSGKTDKGAGKTKINAIIEGDQIAFAVNGRYITDFINAMDSEELVFNLVNSQKPMIISDKGNESYKYVVRPLISN